jgi:hypothetical protein
VLLGVSAALASVAFPASSVASASPVVQTPPTPGDGPQTNRRLEAESPPKSSPETEAAATPEQLLRFAFETATEIPRDPHLKDRSRTQEAVVLAAIEGGRLDLAADLVERMDGWRRGTAYADVASALAAERPDDPRIRRYLALASNLGETAESWRKDRIRMAVARAHARLGESAEVARIARTIAPEEIGKIDAARAAFEGGPAMDEETFAARQAELAAVVATGNFDLVRPALAAQVAYFERFHEDDARRSAIEAAIRESWVKVPHSIRIDLLLEMSAIAATRGDLANARRFASDAIGIVEANRWVAESEVPILGRIAKAFAAAEADEEARGAIARAEEIYAARLREIYDIYRADALRPVAEAWVALGDAEQARATYLRVLEAGVENPNARPRAIDLAATARSMATSGFHPDAEMLEGMRAIRTRLGDPW